MALRFFLYGRYASLGPIVKMIEIFQPTLASDAYRPCVCSRKLPVTCVLSCLFTYPEDKTLNNFYFIFITLKINLFLFVYHFVPCSHHSQSHVLFCFSPIDQYTRLKQRRLKLKRRFVTSWTDSFFKKIRLIDIITERQEKWCRLTCSPPCLASRCMCSN